MAEAKQKSLSQGHRQAIGLDNADTGQGNRPAAPGVAQRLYHDERGELLSGLPAHAIKKAWFTLAHLLLEPGSTIIDMGCHEGMVSYAMAVLNPDINIIALDRDQAAIKQARQSYDRPNLTFRIGDMDNSGLEAGTIDAIVNANTLHEIYSDSGYNARQVGRTLKAHFSLLKPDGYMLIHDYALPAPEEYVLLEFPDIQNSGEDIETMSEADLLTLYSESARPHHDPGCSGFFLEELPARYPHTRLFRLPSKWAYEFIMRKDDRANWDKELHKEYTYFTQRDYRREIRGLGARVLYSAPHWEDNYIKAHFAGRFRLYSDDGSPMGYPPTSFLLMAQKVGQKRSLALQERRKSRNTPQSLQIRAVRDEVEGRLSDIVGRDTQEVDILPYRIREGEKLSIFIHEGKPRGLVNAVPRCGKNLDGKRWSGHMVEAISVPKDVVETRDNTDDISGFTRDNLGLPPAPGAVLETGPSFYPDPHHIDERIQTRFIRVQSTQKTIRPTYLPPDAQGFSGQGRLRELDAQAVLNAISVGLIPSSRLELQILALYRHLNMKAENWTETPLSLSETQVENPASFQSLLKSMAEDDGRFRDVKGTSGDLRIVQSVFVDEGQSADGAMAGLASRDLDFMIFDENTVNTAIVLPLTKDIGGEVMAGIVQEYLPVPQRYKGNGFTVSAPSFPLPKDIHNIEMAKRYIAEQFETDPENVARMGESFFCHIGITPHKIYPFVVTNVKGHYDGRTHGTTQYTNLRDLWKLLYWDNHDSFMKIVAQSYQQFCEDNEFSVNHSFDESFAQNRSTPQWTESPAADTASAGMAGEASLKSSESEQAVSSNTLLHYRVPD